MNPIKKTSKKILLTTLLTFIFLFTNFVSDSIIPFESFSSTEIVYAKPKSSGFKSSSFKSSSSKTTSKSSGGYKSSSFSSSKKGKSSASKNFSSGSFSTSKKETNTNDNNANTNNSDNSTTSSTSDNKKYQNTPPSNNKGFSIGNIAYGLSRLRYSRGYYGSSGFYLGTILTIAVIFIIVLILIKIYLNRKKY